MNPLTITDPVRLGELCGRLGSAQHIGIDTEFVSEDTFFPELCLIQVATKDELATIDAFAIEDLRPFWQVLTQGDHITILHAGREELNFMLRAVGAVPKHLFDVQIAAGFCSNEYPSAYGSVVSRFLGHKPAKGEQRTDWRKRPLTNAQINYALEDVRYLLPLYHCIVQILTERERLSWLEEEMQSWQEDVIAAQDRKDWRRVSGTGKLSPASLAVVRELWHWRYEEAQRRNRPQRRILRDDLIVELAKRKVDSPKQIMAVRGMERSAVKKNATELAACVRRGLESPVESEQRGKRRQPPSQLNLLGQFLAPALGTICHRAELAASLAGTASSVRDLIAYRMGFPSEGSSRDGRSPLPSLARGWRAELVGKVIDDLLEGKKSIRIVNAKDTDPLVFEDVR
ncbi:MAG: HRDC domain-containing protein [Planctomycetales bacterium]|nr:HRDC domain-containing protein [Planctomycetales bacterium]